MSYYPAFLDLRGRPVLVVGGGGIAEQKVRQLLDAGADVLLVSPEAVAGLAALAASGQIRRARRGYEDADLDGVWLAIAATDDEQVQARIARACAERRIWCNVVDVTSRCTFIAPAVLRQGPVQVAVSTSGLSPALAQRITQDLEHTVGPEHAELAKILGRWRGHVRRHIQDQARRAALFQRVLATDVLDLLRQGQRSAAKARIARLIRAASAPIPATDAPAGTT